MRDGAVGRGDLGPAHVDVVVPPVADRGVEDADVPVEDRRDERSDDVLLEREQRAGDPVAGGDVVLEGAPGELHGEEPIQPGTRTTPGLLRGAPLGAARGPTGQHRRPGGRVTVRFSLAAVRRTGDLPSFRTRV